jgi:hypothetical protein
MATQEKYFNPFATNMDDSYTQPKLHAPEKTLDALVSELFRFKPLTQESAELMARFHTLKSELAEHLADVRAAKIEQLEEKRDEAIKLERHAKKKLAQSEQEAFELL